MSCPIGPYASQRLLLVNSLMKHLLYKLDVLIAIQDGIVVMSSQPPALFARQILDDFRSLLCVHWARHWFNEMSSKLTQPVQVRCN